MICEITLTPLISELIIIRLLIYLLSLPFDSIAFYVYIDFRIYFENFA